MNFIVSSSIRSEEDLHKMLSAKKIYSKTPNSGDLGFFQVLDDKNGYASIEDNNGTLITLKKDDIFIGVFGNRMSGVNVFGELPKRKLAKLDTLDLLALGGLVGDCINGGNLQKNSKPTKLKFLGFAVNKNNNKVLNLSTFSKCTFLDTLKVSKIRSVYCVFGTSAEVGKTTLMNKIISILKTKNEQVAAIKVCGTGRLKDKISYLNAKADVALDFVDYGVPTTYSIPRNKYQKILQQMINDCAKKCTSLVCEIGGDMIEANAPSVLELIRKRNYSLILIVNDAMGAIEGIRRIKAKGIEKFCLCSWRQNSFSLQKRLKLKKVYNASDINDVKKMVEYLYE